MTLIRQNGPISFVPVKKTGLVGNLISWVKVLYYSPQAVISTNGPDCFQMLWGTRRGHPLSALLVTTTIEPLTLCAWHAILMA